jgi:hypothetical protein
LARPVHGIQGQDRLGLLNRAADRPHPAQLLHLLQKGPLLRAGWSGARLDLQGNELGEPLADQLRRDL